MALGYTQYGTNGLGIVSTDANLVEAQMALSLAAQAASQVNSRVQFATSFAVLATKEVAVGDVVHTSGYTSAGDGGGGTYVADALATSGLVSAHPRFASNTATPGVRLRLMLIDGGVNVDQGGAAGTGAGDDTPAINAAYAYVKAMGGRIVRFTGSRRYRAGTEIAMGSNVIWEFNGATLLCEGQILPFANRPPGTVAAATVATVTANVLGPTNVISVTELANITIGRVYLVRLGDNPSDDAEPLWGQPARVIAKSAASGAGTITIDHIVPRSINVLGVTGPLNKNIVELPGGDDVRINDLRFEGNTLPAESVEYGVYAYGVYNLVVNNIIANINGQGDVGAGILAIQFGRNIEVNSPQVYYNKNGRNQASLGRAFTFSNCEKVAVNDPFVRGIAGNAFFVESNCDDVIVRRLRAQLLANFAAGTALFFAGQGSRLEIEDPQIETLSGTQDWAFHDSGGTDARVLVRGIIKIRGSLPRGIDPGDYLLDYKNPAAYSFTGAISNGSGGAGNTLVTTPTTTGIPLGTYIYGTGVNAGCRITVDLGGGSYTVSGTAVNLSGVAMRGEEFIEIDFRNARSVQVKAPLQNGVSDSSYFDGPIYDIFVAAKSDADLTNASGIYLGYGTINHDNLKAQFQQGKILSSDALKLRARLGSFYGGFARMSGRSYMTVSGGTSTGGWVGVIAKQGVVLRTSRSGTGAAVPSSRDDFNVADVFSDFYLQRLLTNEMVLEGSANLTPGAIADGAQATLGTISVPNSRLIDPIPQVSAPASMAGLQFWAGWTANGTLTIYARNNTGASVTPPAGIYRAVGRKV